MDLEFFLVGFDGRFWIIGEGDFIYLFLVNVIWKFKKFELFRGFGFFKFFFLFLDLCMLYYVVLE